ncbi:MAG TPA: hypothetical protein PLO67_16570 [Saprospiraceae bacterium]|nr:hypothetical protein [Saprospiraceae bacterium]HPI06799.1 hypothetical protein [Saprospiraceae bacterium]
MPNLSILKFLILFAFIPSCEYSPKNVLEPRELGCGLWWLYDERPTSGFICFDAKKYRFYTITRTGALRRPFPSDVIDPLTEYGEWEIKNDSLFLQGKSYSEIKNTFDTVYIRSNVFLMDETHKFQITNCNCDNLVAQFKGGVIDSIQTLLNYKEGER